MKGIKAILGLLLAALILAACQVSGGAAGAGNPPAKALVAGAKGLFVQAGATSLAARSLAVNRSLTGRSIVSSSGLTLAEITSGNIPQAVTWTDSSGAQVAVTINEATQLTPSTAATVYVLLNLTYSGGTETDVLNLSTGGLATIGHDPDTWKYIAVDLAGDTMWYVSGGAIYKTALATGAETVVSASAQGDYSNGSSVFTATSAWPDSTWLYADGTGNLIALNFDQGLLMSTYSPSDPVMDYAFPAAGGAPVWIGVAGLWEQLQVTANQIAIDPASGTLYAVQTINNQVVVSPYALTIAGTGSSFGAGTPITLTPKFNWGSGASAMYPVGGGEGFGSKFFYVVGSVGPGGFELSDSGSGPAITSFGTANVPFDGTNGLQASPYQYSSGGLYVGPPGVDPTSRTTVNYIGQVTNLIDGQTAQDPPVVAPTGTLQSWTVAGGIAVWSDASGTFYNAAAPSSATTGTPYSGSALTVQAVTQ